LLRKDGVSSRYIPWSRSTSWIFGFCRGRSKLNQEGGEAGANSLCLSAVSGMRRAKRFPACGSQCTKPNSNIIAEKAWLRIRAHCDASRLASASPVSSLSLTPSIHSIVSTRPPERRSNTTGTWISGHSLNKFEMRRAFSASRRKSSSPRREASNSGMSHSYP